MTGKFAALFVATLVGVVLAIGESTGGERKSRYTCGVENGSTASKCKPQRHRKAFPQLDLPEPLYRENTEPLVLPPLQGVLNSPPQRRISTEFEHFNRPTHPVKPNAEYFGRSD
jgi:hypothetical protein